MQATPSIQKIQKVTLPDSSKKLDQETITMDLKRYKSHTFLPLIVVRTRSSSAAMVPIKKKETIVEAIF